MGTQSPDVGKQDQPKQPGKSGSQNQDRDRPGQQSGQDQGKDMDKTRQGGQSGNKERQDTPSRPA
jgi:hypothetical protein